MLLLALVVKNVTVAAADPEFRRTFRKHKFEKPQNLAVTKLDLFFIPDHKPR